MSILGLDHVQLAMPEGGEEAARGFYAGLLGMAEEQKPAALAGRGGCWFKAGSARVHLGVEADFRPARKAHPALLVDDLAAMEVRFAEAGIPVKHDVPLDGYDRLHVQDPFENRIELMQILAR
ncbi:glyoxalase [Xaviernesmea oryzae]|uniref:Glyoxalase n=1 Tax=Xaviernesmea oryzae TaxID=464029 RepID=A0A1Q9ARN3_9HYPH|nr:VOC family protein [Xaviernesmea oryzae]OLP58048.1 glyoxalase [Xaviernesmea oryzae]SEL84437.1 hypothetical protein SAMN04487976_113155 [Xaviernesmea oryzae]